MRRLFGNGISSLFCHRTNENDYFFGTGDRISIIHCCVTHFYGNKKISMFILPGFKASLGVWGSSLRRIPFIRKSMCSFSLNFINA
jgi:hypothetical protein